MMTPLICFPGKSEQNEGELLKKIIILAISFSINIIDKHKITNNCGEFLILRRM